jgi:hypothetical protein
MLGIVWGDWLDFAYAFGICVGFTFGGVMSGIIIGKVHFKLNPSYGYAILIQSMMLGVAACECLILFHFI